MDIFVSYSSIEFAQAHKIKEILENNGFTLWIAPECIPGGSNYTKEIPAAIRMCPVFLLVLSENAQNSIWVSAEVENAFKNKKTIIPFAVDNCQLREEFDFLLSRCQRIDAYGKMDEALDQLLGRLRAIFKREEKRSVQVEEKAATSATLTKPEKTDPKPLTQAVKSVQYQAVSRPNAEKSSRSPQVSEKSVEEMLRQSHARWSQQSNTRKSEQAKQRAVEEMIKQSHARWSGIQK